MARKHPCSYPPEFGRNIIELARAGRSMLELSNKFKIDRQTIATWNGQDDLDAGRRSDGLTSAEHDEVSKLRKRVRQLEIERDILSKAAAWFVRETDSILTKSIPKPVGDRWRQADHALQDRHQDQRRVRGRLLEISKGRCSLSRAQRVWPRKQTRWRCAQCRVK